MGPKNERKKLDFSELTPDELFQVYPEALEWDSQNLDG